jgi:serine/threonine-protein kinase
MLDLIVAKALAKLVDERYQTMREFADDLAQVKRLLHAKLPSSDVLAKQAPPSAKPLAADALGVGRYQKGRGGEEEAKPLQLYKAFDSFDATVKLAAMTNQISEFGDYISETQKMRAYQGAITGALADPVTPSNAAAKRGGASSASIPPESSGTSITLEQMRKMDDDRAGEANPPSNLLPIIIVVLLAALAVGLSVALALR